MRNYAKYQVYILTIGRNPKGNDGVWNYWYPAYDMAFSSDLPSRVFPAISQVLDDLDYILGKIESISEKEFEDIFNKKRKTTQVASATPKKENKDYRNYWNYSHPIWLLYQLWRIVWKYKVISLLIVLVGLLAIDYSLAWKNFLWLWAHAKEIFEK